MQTQAPTPNLPFSAQLIGRTEKSLDALLKRALNGSGLSEPEYVALRVCSHHSGQQRASITAQLAAAFHKGKDHAAALIERLQEARLIDTDPEERVELTPVGTKLHDRLVAQTDEITDRLWGDLPSDELAVAARVLSTVLNRAAVRQA
jgi:DNA-binding MarR family transcriptional regulator